MKMERTQRTMQLDALKPRMMALAAKKTVARCLGRLYIASRYTFSPPLRGNIVPSSSQMKRPERHEARPRSQSIKAAPTLPTLDTTDEGVEKIPVPMMRPMLGSHVSLESAGVFEMLRHT